MSGTIHNSPFRHYHRVEDGTTYFVLNGEIYSAPTCSGAGSSACCFDVDGPALAIKDWESPSEFEPFRREVERALGLPLTLNALEKVRDAINAMGCEWKSDYDYPDFLSVYPKGPAADDDGVAWSFGLDYVGTGQHEKIWVGNDRSTQNSETFPYNEKADPVFMAGRIVRFMRETAIRRVQWLNNFASSCVKHIEQTSGTSPASVVGPWAGSKGAAAYDEARAIIATWEGGRA